MSPPEHNRQAARTARSGRAANPSPTTPLSLWGILRVYAAGAIMTLIILNPALRPDTWQAHIAALIIIAWAIFVIAWGLRAAYRWLSK